VITLDTVVTDKAQFDVLIGTYLNRQRPYSDFLQTEKFSRNFETK